MGAPWGSHTPLPPPPPEQSLPSFLAWPSNLACSLGVQHDLSQGCQGLSGHTGPAFVYRAKSLSSMQSALVGIRTAPFRQGRLCGHCVVAYSAEAGRALIWPHTGIFIYRSFTGMYRSEENCFCLPCFTGKAIFSIENLLFKFQIQRKSYIFHFKLMNVKIKKSCKKLSSSKCKDERKKERKNVKTILKSFIRLTPHS